MRHQPLSDFCKKLKPATGLLFVFLSSLTIFPSARIGLAHEAQDLSSGLALERAVQAQEISKEAMERVDKAIDAAETARLAAKEALSNSNIAIETSDRRLASVEKTLNLLSIGGGLFLLIFTIMEIFRRVTETSGAKRISEVVALIEQTFKVNALIAEQQADLSEKLAQETRDLEEHKRFYKDKFAELYERAVIYTKITRMEWPSIDETHPTQKFFAKAQQTFEIINPYILRSQENDARKAQICYLFGVSSLYRNEIVTARDYLSTAQDLYDGLGGIEYVKQNTHKFPYIFCHHFIGILEKNWFNIDMDYEQDPESQDVPQERRSRGGKALN